MSNMPPEMREQFECELERNNMTTEKKEMRQLRDELEERSKEVKNITERVMRETKKANAVLTKTLLFMASAAALFMLKIFAYGMVSHIIFSITLCCVGVAIIAASLSSRKVNSDKSIIIFAVLGVFAMLYSALFMLPNVVRDLKDGPETIILSSISVDKTYRSKSTYYSIGGYDEDCNFVGYEVPRALAKQIDKSDAQVIKIEYYEHSKVIDDWVDVTSQDTQ